MTRAITMCEDCGKELPKERFCAACKAKHVPPPWLRLYIGGPQDGSLLRGDGTTEPPAFARYLQMFAITFNDLEVKFLCHESSSYRAAWEHVAEVYATRALQ